MTRKYKKQSSQFNINRALFPKLREMIMKKYPCMIIAQRMKCTTQLLTTFVDEHYAEIMECENEKNNV